MTDKRVPRILAICGSTRFIEPIAATAWHFEKKGLITFFPLLIPWQACRESDGGPHQAEAFGVKAEIDELFKRKIDLADEVLVMDIDGYIGESTSSEAAYAISLYKPVRYYSQDKELRSVIETQFAPEELKACR